MKKRPPDFVPEFKAKVALEAVRGQRSIQELAKRHGISPSLVIRWEQRLIDALPSVFAVDVEVEASSDVEGRGAKILTLYPRAESRAAKIERNAETRPQPPPQRTGIPRGFRFRTGPVGPKVEWRIEGGEWRREKAFAHALLNLAKELIDLDSRNVDRLKGGRVSVDLHDAAEVPPDRTTGLKMCLVPGYPMYTICPYAPSDTILYRMRDMGERCGLKVEVTVPDA